MTTNRMIVLVVRIITILLVAGLGDPAYSYKLMQASVNIGMSVDGFIATKDGGVEWLNEYPPPEGEDFGFGEFLDSVDVLVMGRNSFEKVLSFGPGLWAYGKKKVVVWTRDESRVKIPLYLQATVGCSTLQPKELLTKLHEEGYKHAYIDGGTTIQKFLECGLINKISLTRVPILLGEGIPLFGNQMIKLSHVTTKTHSNGSVTSTYEVVPDSKPDEISSENTTKE